MSLLWLVACGGGPAPEVSPPSPPSPSALQVRHHSMLEGRAGDQMPPGVSATWVDAGLQVMVSGLRDVCAPVPTFDVAKAESTWTLTQQEPTGKLARCTGAHTMILEVPGEPADLTVRVVHRDGSTLGTASVGRDTR